jgi:hypothetical protein
VIRSWDVYREPFFVASHNLGLAHLRLWINTAAQNLQKAIPECAHSNQVPREDLRVAVCLAGELVVNLGRLLRLELLELSAGQAICADVAGRCAAG